MAEIEPSGEDSFIGVDDFSRIRKAVGEGVLGVAGITVLYYLLLRTGATTALASSVVLLFLGFPLYLTLAEKLSESLFNVNLREMRGQFALAAIFVPYIAFVASQVLFAGAGLADLPMLAVEYLKGFTIFLIAASLYLRMREDEDFKNAKFHWQLAMTIAVVAVVPTIAVLVAKAVLGMV